MQVRCCRALQMIMDKHLKRKEKHLVLWAEGVLGNHQEKSEFEDGLRVWLGVSNRDREGNSCGNFWSIC